MATYVVDCYSTKNYRFQTFGVEHENGHIHFSGDLEKSVCIVGVFDSPEYQNLHADGLKARWLDYLYFTLQRCCTTLALFYTLTNLYYALFVVLRYV